MSKRRAQVTDHFLIRYLERVKGFDFDGVRAEILNDTVRAAIAAGATAILIEGHRCPVSPDGAILTILENRPNGNAGRGRARA